ncbi:xanthine dehydrogenase family protein molybdopterin-binding subunit [Jeotgalibacillus soli]|uniref:Xanthine dehydrogenase n=1 Tax=Jeotgalibacillus soli TaxID=889306 RepID=A0A0C2V872_9BACL|nr:xanthine dehydrogenase family protein molybdopterin-binding subunit [Jeotgalibacillus soli]KIL45157.1 xanthine dehydrogenase [Jeotgalibacillus soli]
METIGKSIIRKEALDKVTGKAKYTGDYQSSSMLHAKMVISPYAHAKIKSINIQNAWKVQGVRGIVTGQQVPLVGEAIQDRPILAQDKVRYHGEPLAVVVADDPILAKRAADLIAIDYELLPVVNSPSEAIKPDTILVHEHLDCYKRAKHITPIPGTNIASRFKIRKGNMDKGWRESNVIVEDSYSFTPSDHAAIETRCSIVEIRSDESIIVSSSSQAPYMIKQLMSMYFGIDMGKVIVNTPLVGGGYGGKAAVQLELIAYLASKAVGGRKVKLENTREEDIITSPCHIGLDAKVKLGCSKDGFIKAAEILYLFDGGAYSDKGIDLSRAAAVDCTGPYHIENIWCDSFCMYTNHPYASPYRGFSHSELLFAFERTVDLLAEKLQMDPFELRYKNAILPGHTTPTQTKLNHSNIGNLRACIDRAKELSNWDEGQMVEVDKRFVRVKGASCIWKTSTIPSNASSGVIITFNKDGTLNLMSGVVEIGTGTKTILAQILAEYLKMNVDHIFVRMDVDTQTTPEHWKTVGSRGTFMAGRAVLEAADDTILQLKSVASCVLRTSIDDLIVANSRVFLRDDPTVGLGFEELAYGYTFENGNSIGGQIIGRGNYILRNITPLNPETGAGNPGPEWTVGAQVVEVEYDRRDYTYKLIKATSVIDIGKVLNEKAARGQVTGAMSMGLGFAARETFRLDQLGRVLNHQLRTYRPIHFGEHPEYAVGFIETPQLDAPYGARGVGEHGILGMPAALGNCLSLASGVSLHQLPLTPELIWREREGKSDLI